MNSLKGITTTIILAFTMLACSKKDLNFQGENSETVTIQWQQTFGHNDFDEINQIIQTSDGGYIAVGAKMLNANWNYWVLKFNQQDSLQWDMTYGGTYTDIAKAVVETENGEFLIIGYTNSYEGDITTTKGNYDIWLIKIDSTGKILWNKNYGGLYNDIISYKSLIKTQDNNFLFMGTTNSKDTDVSTALGDRDIWVVKINPQGEIIWEKSLGGDSEDNAETIVADPISGFYLCAVTASNNGNIDYNYGYADVWVAKISNEGEIIWQKTVGGKRAENFATLIHCKDNGILIMASSNSRDGDVTNNFGEHDIFFVKLNNEGTVEWRKTFGGTLDESIGDVIQTADGGYLATLKTASDDYYIGTNNGKDDICFVKLSEAGEIQWTKIIGGTRDDFARSFFQKTDNSIITAGTTNSTDLDIQKHIGGFDFWLFNLKP